MKINKNNIKIAVVFISLCQGLQYTVSPVLSSIQENYKNVDISRIQMLVTAPALLSMIVAIASGWMVLKITKKHLVMFGALMCGLCGFFPLFIEGFQVVFYSRILLGIGIGLVTSLNTAVVVTYFEGKERAAVLGLQGACVGIGILLATTVGGWIGSIHYENVYYMHFLGIVSVILLAYLLPKETVPKKEIKEKIKLNVKVYYVCFLGIIEFIFLMSFTSNISMHISGALAGDAKVAGIITGVFSGIQIISGLVINHIVKYTKNYTIYFAMFSYGVGCFCLVVGSGSYIFLILAAIFCGMSQGVFVPRAMFEISSCVRPIATAMASAVFTVSISMGQLGSAIVLGGLSNLFYGNITTNHIYWISFVGVSIFSLLCIGIHKFGVWKTVNAGSEERQV
ncbi:MAG: MFS transporter [Anaerostipes sp.]|nr:MFS transporter [Anaerostipes sp.]